MAGEQTGNLWEIRRLAGALGAEVRGPRLADADDGDIAAIKRLLVEHMVLFFPEQHMSMQEHVALGRPFGPLEGHPNLKERNSVEHPEVFALTASQGGIADEWHTDLTFLAEPALMSILNMVKCPDSGGDTMWSNLCAAFDALSPPPAGNVHRPDRLARCPSP
jgi:taurine dioxygenase